MDWTQRLNAALANCSPFHFMRMFEVVSGLSPGEYSRRRRLSRAAIDLAVGADKVIEVALRYGYESPEAFASPHGRPARRTGDEIPHC